MFVPADTGLFFIVAVKTKSTLSFCFCCLVKYYFSVVISVPLRCFQFSSLVKSAAGKVNLHLFCVCSGWYRFFLYSDNKKYAAFFFFFGVKCYFSSLVTVPLSCFQILLGKVQIYANFHAQNRFYGKIREKNRSMRSLTNI